MSTFITVPAFPNVPPVLGVPPVLRASAAFTDLVSGTVTGHVTDVAGGFVGNIEGRLYQVNGVVSALKGTLSGNLDALGNLAGRIGGPVAGAIVGQFVGLVNLAKGARLSGSVSSAIATQVTGAPGALQADGPAVGQSAAAKAPQWGLFTSGGKAALGADSVLAFDYRSEYRISDFPVEGGEFQSYNKVQAPFEARFTYARGGTDSERTTFLTDAQALIASLDLFTAVTPEKSYQNVNVTHVDYRRTSSNGATLLTVEVWAQQVRVSDPAEFSTTTPLLVAPQDPAAADAVDDGSVQATTPTPAQAAAAAPAVAPPPGT